MLGSEYCRIRSLAIHNGFRLKKEISAESQLIEYIYLSKGTGLLHWHFHTIDYDIGYGVYKVNQVQEDFTLAKLYQYVE